MILYKLSETETKFKYYNLKAFFFKLVLFLKYLIPVILSQVFGTSCKTGWKHFFFSFRTRRITDGRCNILILRSVGAYLRRCMSYTHRCIPQFACTKAVTTSFCAVSADRRVCLCLLRYNPAGLPKFCCYACFMQRHKTKILQFLTYQA